MHTLVRSLLTIMFVFSLTLTCVAQEFNLSNQDSLELVFSDKDSMYFVVKNVNTEKHGCMNKSGDLVVPCEYDYLDKLYNGLRLAYNDSKFGFLNEQGEEQIELQYIGANVYSNGRAHVTNLDGSGVIDVNNKTIIPFKYASLRTKDHKYYAFKENGGKFGIMDSLCNVIVPEVYDFIILQNKSFWIASLDGKCDVFKYNGKKHLDEKLDRIGKASYSGYVSVGVEGKSGMLNSDFNWVIPPKYETTISLFENSIGVKDSLGWNVLDANNKLIIDEVFENISYLDKAHCIVEKDQKKNIINIKGHRILDPNTKNITKIYGDKTLLYIDGYLYDGLIFNKILPEQIVLLDGSRAPNLINGHLGIRINGKCAVLDTIGNIIIPPKYDNCEDLLHAGYLKVEENEGDKWGLINLDNELLVPTKYKRIYSTGGSIYEAKYWLEDETSISYFFNDSILISDIDSIVGSLGIYTIFKKKEKLGFVNTFKGTFKMLEYDSILVDRHTFLVVQDGKYGSLNYEGNLEIPCQYNYLKYTGYYYITKTEDKYGTLSKENKVLESPQFDEIEKDIFKLYGKAYIGNKIGLLDIEGTLILPVEYDSLDVKVSGNVTAQKGDETFNFTCWELQIRAERIRSQLGNEDPRH